jgi:hypothetical protein
VAHEHVSLDTGDMGETAGDGGLHGLLLGADGFLPNGLRDQRGIEERNQVEGHRAVRVLDQIRLAVGIEATDDVNPSAPEEAGGKGNPLGVVMVAGDKEDGASEVFCQFDEGAVEERDGVGGWLRAVVEVASDDQDIGLFVREHPMKLLEEVFLIGCQMVAVKDAAEVPVGGV